MSKRAKIVIALFKANVISLIFFACCLDSDNWIPLIVCIINMIYITLFVLANTIKYE